MSLPSWLLTAALVFSTGGSFAQAPATQTVPLQGEYAQIDTSLTKAMVALLSQGTAKDQQDVISALRERSEKVQPPVFYAVSQVLLQNGEKDEAAFWFYAGQLRARMDANLSADGSTAQAVSVLNGRYGQPINQHVRQDLDKAESLMLRVKAWDEKTPYEYDRRWINLHGMAAFTASMNPDQAAKPLSQPQAQWASIIQKTRADYFQGFKESLAQLRASAAAKQ